VDLTEQMLVTANVFAAATARSRATLATKLRNDGKFFDRVEAGGGVLLQHYEQVMRWFSDNWPAAVPWPAGVLRLGGGATGRCRYEQDLRWFSDNWPAAVPWPAAVTRPGSGDGCRWCGAP
jgi:hypothetical protein